MTASFPVDQGNILVDDDPQNDVPLKIRSVYGSLVGGGRSVAVGKLFGNSDLPDLVYSNGTNALSIFSNLGLNTRRKKFLGFRNRTALIAGHWDCIIRDIRVASLYPCTTSIVCSVFCPLDDVVNGNYMFTKHTAKSRCVKNDASVVKDIFSLQDD